jgi:hypothetical protein
MVYEEGIPIFSEWLAASLLLFFVLGVTGLIVGLLFGFLVSAAQHGPVEGFYRTTKVLFSALTVDLPGFALRRTLAIAGLAVQESLRNRVLVAVFGVFVFILLFAGWFLDPGADDPARLYLSFVLNTSNLLVLVMSIFLATLSLPNDMKNRTIYTVVTKPVRSSEIVIGRILGFAAVGTVLLLVMMVLSYVFVTRGLDHSHTVATGSEERVVGSGPNAELQGYRGVTSHSSGHDHEFSVDAAGVGATELKQGHRHNVTRNADGSYTVGPPLEQFQARVPLYGELTWLDREGKADEKGGISVGQEWEYRRYITGGTQAAAIWRFSGLRREDFPVDEEGKCIPLEITLRIFRTYKGDITQGVLGSLTFRNPNEAANKQSTRQFKRFKEYETDTFKIPLKLDRLPDEQSLQGGRDVKVNEKLDLFDDLVHNGQLEVILKCEEPAQYYGVAAPDLYIRAGERPFYINFFKCFTTMWLEMLVVVSFGVMFSTFLSGPVAFLATISMMVVGYFISFIREIVHGMVFSTPDDPMAYRGGGPIESIIRIMTQQNIQTELEVDEWARVIIQTIDRGFAMLLYATTFVVPELTDFNKIEFVANGYNIDAVLLSTLCLQALAYTAGTTLIAYFILKTREIAQ